MEDFDFKLTCAHCGHKISVPLIYAGKRIKCPKCNDILVVPKAGIAAPSANKGGLKDSKSGTKYAGFDHALFDIPQEDSTVNQLSSQGALSEKDIEELHKTIPKTVTDETESIGIQRLPWIFDIFLYPLSFWGLVNIGIFIGITSFLAEVGKILPDVLSCLFGLLTLVIKVVAYLFIYWYFAECVRDSAEGGLRAPNVRGDVPGAVDMFLQMINIVGCLLVFFMPFVIYVLAARRIDVILWLLLIYAVFFFPMALLAVVVLDSPVGLNPRLLYNSISNTFRQYCGLVLLFVAAVSLMGLLGHKAGESGYLAFIFRCAGVYIVFVAGHLLGRFYWRNQEKLNWKEAES
jgi:DNA-directed RNA polymerase subunit RPC12/RpoP